MPMRVGPETANLANIGLLKEAPADCIHSGDLCNTRIWAATGVSPWCLIKLPIRSATLLRAALTAAAVVEIRPAACADRGFPSADDLVALRPQRVPAFQVLQNSVPLTAVEKGAGHGSIEAILLDAARARRARGV